MTSMRSTRTMPVVLRIFQSGLDRMKTRLLTNSQNTRTYLFIIFLLILSFTRLQFLVLIWVVWESSRYIQLSTSRFINSVWGYVLFSCLVMSIGGIAWLLKIPASTTLVTIVMLLLYFTGRIWLKPPDKTALSDTKSVLIVGLLTVSFGIFLVSIPLIRTHTTVGALRNAVMNRDDLNHFEMIEANRSNSGYIYMPADEAAKLVTSTFTGYPQGWHLNGAVWESSISRLLNNDSAALRVWFYAFYKILWFGIAIITIYYLLFLLSSKQTVFSKKLILQQVSLVSLSTVFITLIVLVPLFYYGFHNFLATITLFCFSLIATTLFLINRLSIGQILFLFCLFIPASSFLWIITLPAMFGIFIMAGLVFGLRSVLAKNIRPWQWLLLLSALLLSLVPIFAQQHFGGSNLQGLNQGGAIPPLAVNVVIAGWLAILGIVSSKSTQSSLTKTTLCSVPVLIMVLFLYYYQTSTVGAISYYTIKTAYLATIILLCLASSYLIKLLVQKHTFVISLVILGSLLLCIPVLLNSNIGLAAYPLKNNRIIREETAAVILDSRSDTFFIGNTDPEEDYLASRMTVLLFSGFASADREAFINIIDHSKNQTLETKLQSYNEYKRLHPASLYTPRVKYR